MALRSRNGRVYLYKRVPKRYASVEVRRFIWLSLHTDSVSLAESKASATWAQMVEGWEAKLAGDTGDAEARFEAARELAAVRGFRYLSAPTVAKLPLEEILTRIETIGENRRGSDQKDAAAMLGGAPEPLITVTRALELFWLLASDRTIGKSKDQIRRWKNPRIKAVANFVNLVGDKALQSITGDDMLDFRQWWIDRVRTENLSTGSANKDLTHLSDTLRTIVKLKRLEIILPFSDLMLKEGEQKIRPPFSSEWIRQKQLAANALAGLNAEARCLLLGMVNTGYRPSEGAALRSGQIHLETKIPYISIESPDRQLKTTHSKRIIPLAGISLAAFREFPDGFPRYRKNPGFSDTINKFLRENSLMETAAHSLYSLRHSFEDRLLAKGVDERIRRDLMGHALHRERYGAGATLEHLHEVIQAAAL